MRKIDHKKEIQQQFGQNADSYVKSKTHKEGLDLKKIVEIAKLKGQEKVLDIATGGGHTANAFAPLVANVTALDMTPEMLKAAENFINANGHQNVRFILGDAEKLPFVNGEFDTVTCRIAPHHFPNVKVFIDEVYRVLSPGGQFLLDDNVAPEDDKFDTFYNTIEKMRDYSHFRAWKKTEWLKMLELVGFDIDEVHRFEKIFLFDTWCQQLKLQETVKNELTTYMVNASDKVKDKFNIKLDRNQVISFQGEAMILKAIKKR